MKASCCVLLVWVGVMHGSAPEAYAQLAATVVDQGVAGGIHTYLYKVTGGSAAMAIRCTEYDVSYGPMGQKLLTNPVDMNLIAQYSTSNPPTYTWHERHRTHAVGSGMKEVHFYVSGSPPFSGWYYSP